jgi:hypothetical protein
VGHAERMSQMRNVNNILVGGQLGKPRCRWKDKIKTGPKETECEGSDWVRLASDGTSYWVLCTG